jgi:hypothetical protein
MNLHKLWKQLNEEPIHYRVGRAPKTLPCFNCGLREAGNDLLCGHCRSFYERKKDVKGFHLLIG